MTELQLYKFVQGKEIAWRGEDLTLWIPFYDLQEFTRLVGHDYFSEGDVKVALLSDCIAVVLNDLCECFDIEPENILEKDSQRTELTGTETAEEVNTTETTENVTATGTMGNVRTMEFLGKDSWDRPVYKCIEDGRLWKDVSLGENKTPHLYSVSEYDGEPSWPIKSDLVIVFKTKYEKNPHQFNYMLLSRLQSDCEYYLGYGNRNKSRLWADNVKAHIDKMKELHNSFPEGQKPEWLTYENILEYERQMSE